MSNIKLDEGSIKKMLENDTSIAPRLQVLDIKKIVTGHSGEGFRLVLSDGDYFIQGILATQCIDLVKSSKLKKYTIVHLKEFACNTVSNKTICVVIQCDVIQQSDHGIGRPCNVSLADLNNSISSIANQKNENQNHTHRQQPIYKNNVEV